MKFMTFKEIFSKNLYFLFGIMPLEQDNIKISKYKISFLKRHILFFILKVELR